MKMVPKDFKPLKTDPGFSGAEKKLFNIFQNMPDTKDWVCLHSLRFISSDPTWYAHIDREIDFILFIPSRGIFLIEVKGGGISYDSTEETYYTTNLDNKRHKIKDPFKQIKDAKYALIEWIKKKKGIKLVDICSQGVFFPDTLKSIDVLPRDGEQSFVFYEGDLANLRSKILNIFTVDLPLEKTQIIKDLISFFTPRDFNSQMSFESIINYSRDRINRATQEQMKMLEFLSLCPRAIINGVAGSGKTVLALTKAIQIAQNNPENKVLYVCFTKKLPELLKAQYTDLPDNLAVLHFHKLAYELLKGRFPDSPSDDDWNRTIPNLILELSPEYDAIFVDESQDFTEAMLLALEHLCKNENDYFWLFGDTNQNLFRKTEPPFTQYFRGNYVFPLTINCRNPKEVAEYAYAHIPNIPYKMTLNEEGTGKAETVQCNSEEDQVEKIIDLIKTKKIPVKNTIVLTMRPKIRALDASVFKSKHSNMFEEFNSDHTPTRIPVSNIQNFKGMEAEVVILCDVDNRTDAIEMYTASTRATSFLYVFHIGDLSIEQRGCTPLSAPFVTPPVKQVSISSASSKPETTFRNTRRNPFL